MRIHHLGVICLAGGLSLSCAASAAAQARSPVNLHVATNGNDLWSGRLAAPNADRTDGPLASLAGAQGALRRLHATAQGSLSALTVHVHGGIYRLEAPLVIEPQDSGS